MSSQEPPALQLKPIISYPREAQVGKTYLVSIDVQLATPNASWDYPEEEYTIGFILNTSPYFTCEPLHDVWPTIILHRYGGTYGPAEFLLTAAEHEIERGQISITLVNGWGIPMTRLELPCEVNLESGVPEEYLEFPLPSRPEIVERGIERIPIPVSLEEQEERERLDRIATMLTEAGWTLMDMTDPIAPQTTSIAIRIHPHTSIERRDGTTTTSVTDSSTIGFLLIINHQAVGIIIREGFELLMETSALKALINPSGVLLASSLIHSARDPLPFIYEMQGEEIRFTNNLEPDARTRTVFHFHRPETFALWLEQAPVGTPNDLNDLLRSRLRRMPPVLEAELFANQFEAITKLETSFAQNRPRALVQMANSTALLVYSMDRLLKFGGARRILYLVDNAKETIKILDELGRYTATNDNQPFSHVYDVHDTTFNGERDDLPLISSLLDEYDVYIMNIAQIYHLFSNAIEKDEEIQDSAITDISITYQTGLPIEFFDVIFVVECFDELQQRYRPILDYFDAFLVGVGADIPSRVATLFHRNLVYQEQSPTASVLTQRIWNYCNLIRDDGVSYGDYLEQLTYLLYLKMCDERTMPPFNEPPLIPKGYDWQSLLERSGSELEVHYNNILNRLGKEEGILGIIFRRARNKIQDPAKLRRLIVDLVESQNWNGLAPDILGDIYEGLLEKNAEDSKSGAGQYFTPRSLINAMVDTIHPEPGMRIYDPASGTGGFLLAAQEYIIDHNQLTRQQATILKNETFYGEEIIDSAARLGNMNLLLHDIRNNNEGDPPIIIGDSLLKSPSKHFDIVLSNPPFGRKISPEEPEPERADFWAKTSNKQLNFVQHTVSSLKIHGKAAIVIPDNVLFEGGVGEQIRSHLLKECDVHTLLRLPSGIFYAQSIKTNVLFFDRMPAREKPWTKELWIYDLRTNYKFSLRTNPLKREHLEDFVRCYNPENRHDRKETTRFRKFSYDELIKRDKLNLNISWQIDENPVGKDPESDEQFFSPNTLARNMVEDLTDTMDTLRSIIPDDEKHHSQN